jgi:hypothetical protein
VNDSVAWSGTENCSDREDAFVSSRTRPVPEVVFLGDFMWRSDH